MYKLIFFKLINVLFIGDPSSEMLPSAQSSLCGLHDSFINKPEMCVLYCYLVSHTEIVEKKKNVSPFSTAWTVWMFSCGNVLTWQPCAQAPAHIHLFPGLKH